MCLQFELFTDNGPAWPDNLKGYLYTVAKVAVKWVDHAK